MKRIKPRDRWALAVYMLVRDERGRVLMLRRSQSVKHFPGCWELPGGKPASGEQFDKTAEFEVTEETGLYVSPTGVAGAVESSASGMRLAILVLEGSTSKTSVTLSEEHDTYCWLPVGQIESLKLRPGFDTFISTYASGPRRGKRRKAAAKAK
jgi:8-oxo-dGTP diphosphatase